MSRQGWLIALAVSFGVGQQASAQQQITVESNFDGMAAGGTAPAEPAGKAGTTQFVQWVNRRFAVYNKTTGALLQAPRPGNSLWTGFGGPCETMNSGMPMVEFDKQAGRWVLAQLALSTPAYYCMAVSITGDATGAYNRYAFPFPANQSPGAPRLAVWPDAYYASFNLQSGNKSVPYVVAYDRTNMLAGLPARKPISFLPAVRRNILPGDFDGTQPPTLGEPEFYATLGGPNTIDLYRFHVDFTNPPASTFSSGGQVAMQSKGLGCSRNPPLWQNGTISQPATTTKLDAHPDQLMYRLAWRKVNQVEHLVTNQTVILSDNPPVAGIVWYDIVVQPAAAPMLAQQGTVSNAATSYWIGSAGQDKKGDIALAFNVSSSSVFPSVAVTSRLSTDPAGAMTSPVYFAQGGGSQVNSSKWGTHSDLSLDPVDDCVFWVTGEYVKATASGFDWDTRITSLRFNACK
jgi:hypothetical protein